MGAPSLTEIHGGSDTLSENRSWLIAGPARGSGHSRALPGSKLVPRRHIDRVSRAMGEGGNLQLRLNVFNVFNRTNLSPFTFNTPSTVVQSQFFGTAGNTPALAGRVVEVQARISF